MQKLVEFLSSPQAYPEYPTQITLVQTHISWVFIGDTHVYKVKKPVRFDFLDYSTLERRRFYTGEELRLNRRFSPGIYLDVVPVSMQADRYLLGDSSNVVEYVLRMRRISEEHMLRRLLQNGLLHAADMRRLGRHIAGVYGLIPSDDQARPFGAIDAIAYNCRENFEETRPYIDVAINAHVFAMAEAWTFDFLHSKAHIFEDRLRQGFIKDGHGDLHLDHICLHPDHIDLIDCIEFSPRLRCGDVAQDIAFLAMDLDDNGYPELSRAFVDGYVAASGDTGLLNVLTFYKVYRAMVRAKVNAFRLNEYGLSPDERTNVLAAACEYFDLAASYIKKSAQ